MTVEKNNRRRVVWERENVNGFKGFNLEDDRYLRKILHIHDHRNTIPLKFMLFNRTKY